MIAKELIHTGIIQSGYFVDDGHVKPIRLQLGMLASYPELMLKVAEMIVTEIRKLSCDRLVAENDAVAVSSIAATQLLIPLVYQRAGGSALELIGAYDAGHPACMITNTIHPETIRILGHCKQVGLDVHTIITIVGKPGYSGTTQIVPLLKPDDLLRGMEGAEASQLEAVRHYINSSPFPL